MSFNRFSRWLLVSKIKGRVRICAFILGVTFLSVLILHVSAGSTNQSSQFDGSYDHKRPGDTRQSKSSAELLRKAKTRSKAQRAPIAQPKQDDTKVVSSGKGAAQTGVARPEVSSGPVYSKIPELTPVQAKSLKRESEEEEPIVPVQQGRVWTEIPKPTDPPTEPVFGESGLHQMSGLISPQAASDFRYQQVTDLSSNGSFSEINEPSVANMGSTVFFTGNWYAARSTNGGQTFTYVSPFTTFPSVNGGFCCDQVVNYAPSQDMMLWETQYLSDGTSNTIRIARAVGSAAVANNSWTSYKFTPQDFGFPTGTYLDFPNLTFGSTFVYLTENVFTSGGTDQDSHGTFTGSVILRIRLSELAAGGSISYNYYAQTRSSSDVGSLRCTEGAGATIYCGGWRTTSQLRIFHWDDGASSIFWDDVNAAAFTTLDRGNGVATSPDGTNFAARADGRILGAWVANGFIGFMWAAKQDSTFPYPYTIVARFDQLTRARVSQNTIWNSSVAWLYPTASPNSAGNLAGLLAFGGGANYPGTDIWIADDVEIGFSPVGLHGSTGGTAGPTSNKWGDYLTVRPHRDFPNTWVAAAYSLKNGGLGSNAVPRYLWFGRERDFGSTPSPTVRLTATDFPVNENSSAGFVTVSVIREGDATSAASVNFATSDTSSLNAACSQGGTGKASERCDYATSLGTLSWAAGEAGTKTFNIPIINDAIVEGNETFNVTLSSPTGVSLGTPSTATVTILDDDVAPSTNPIDGVDFFITQQYIDFLGRMPDQGGFTNWHNTLAPCPNGGFGEPVTSNCDRLHVAAGFFQSDEFLNRGYWAFCFYMVSYNQRPTYAQFIPDMAQVGGPKSPAEEQASKAAFADAYVQRAEFVAKYGAQSGQPLANALWLTAGLPGSPINAGVMTNGQILRTIVETSAAFNKFLPDGTVAIQYFGFLRRDPDTIGYQNNLTTLRNDPNNLRHMIFIFIYSSEYRGRFGTP